VSDDTSLRDAFLLDPDVTFLNHGSYGACPRAVFERYQEWQLELERQPVLFLATCARWSPLPLTTPEDVVETIWSAVPSAASAPWWTARTSPATCR
jgi:hypothetical protein